MASSVKTSTTTPMAQQQLQVELENSRNIHQLKDELADVKASFSKEIGEVRTDIARMPGIIATDIIQQIETHHPIGQSSREAKWALTLMITIMVSVATLGVSALTALAWIMTEADDDQSKVVRDHVSDGHPHTVRASFDAIKAEFGLHSKSQDEDITTLQNDIKQLAESFRLHETIAAREHGEFATKLDIFEKRMASAHSILHDDALGRHIRAVSNTE
jgi:hypothetical protein